MFRNRILVRASTPSPSSFFLIPLSLPQADDDPSPSYNAVDLQILCCKLSRTWRLACFLHFNDIFVIYQRSQSESAARAVEEIVRSLPSIHVGVEEEVRSASLIAKAVECGLRSFMLDNGWTCAGENSFVQSTFACSEEKKHLCAINVRVQAEIDDGFVFLVSPDVLWFKRHKILDLASSQLLEKFENGEVVILEEYGLSTCCRVLPSLYEGHTIGLSKTLPSGETSDRFEELLRFKHGLALPSNCFLNILFSTGCHVSRQWYPSAFVLQGSGLAPAPQTIRASKAIQALEFFINTVGGWDFFSQGMLEVKDVSSLGIGTFSSLWKTATSNLKGATVGESIAYTGETIREQSTGSNHLQLALDFRTPKPAIGCVFGEKHTYIHQNVRLPSNSILDSRVKCTHDADIIKRVKCTHDADIIKLTSVAQNICSESERANEMNAIQKKHTSAVDFSSEITTAESEYARETRKTQSKEVFFEDVMVKTTTEESVSINESSLHERIVAEKKLTSAEDCLSAVTTAESDLVSECSVTEMTDTSSGDCMRESSRISQKKEEIEVFFDKHCSADSTKVPLLEKSAKKTLSHEKKSKEAASGTCKKLKTKHCADTYDIIAKAMDYHSRGALQSLTVPDLKSFLTTKKARVGGKKEELIQRITAFLA